MHFLGLAGMPRRIPRYPNVYEHLNNISSFGVLISTFSTFIFLIVLYRLLCPQNLVKAFDDIIKNLLNSVQINYKKLKTTKTISTALSAQGIEKGVSYFQEPGSSDMAAIIVTHNNLCYLLIMIVALVA